MITIKFGGSLTKDKKVLENLCREIENLSRNYDLVIVPGGGEFADLVRDYDKKLNLPTEISPKMAILAIDQAGFLISKSFKNPVFIHELNGFRNYNKIKNKVKIFIPSKFLFEVPESELKHSWDITSDSISAYIAEKLNAEKLIILTDVDGLYDSNPGENHDAKLIEKINIMEIKNFHDSCLDKKFHEFFKTPCYVINGKFPGRILLVLKNKEFIGTEILI